MAKLSNGIEYNNVNFHSDLGEYLLRNSFRCTAEKNKLQFEKHHTRVIISENTCDVYLFKPELQGEDHLKWIFTGSYPELCKLDLFGWISVLHDLSVVHVLRFLKDQKEKGSQYYNEAKLITYSIS